MQDILLSRETGKCTPLTDKEKQWLQSLIGDNYVIGPQLGRSGARHTAFKLINSQGKDFALKIPNKYSKNWIKEERSVVDKIENYIKGYQGNINISKPINIGDNFLIEPIAKGVEFTENIYNLLSKEEQRQLAEDFAKFLNYSHQKSYLPETIDRMYAIKPSYEEIYQYFSNVANIVELNQLEQAYKKIEDINQKDDISVLCFRDYRSQNVFYDRATNSLSIIGFELVKRSSIYHDFVPFASYGMSYKFLNDVINIYNKEKKGYSLYIDREKVHALHYYGICHEHGRCSIFRGLSLDENKDIYQRFVRPRIEKLNHAFLNTISSRTLLNCFTSKGM